MTKARAKKADEGAAKGVEAKTEPMKAPPGQRASAKNLTGPLGRQTYIFENHFCVVDLPVRGGSVEVLFVGAKFKDGTLATATTSVQTDNAPSSFDLLPWLLAQGVPLEVARPKAKPDEYGRF